jgi:ABC-type transport system involved in cytochrome bd biosynthesis fused ATPase/permease subunit
MILLMEDGRVTERGTHDQLMNARGVYYEMVMRQMESHGGASDVLFAPEAATSASS